MAAPGLADLKCKNRSRRTRRPIAYAARRNHALCHHVLGVGRSVGRVPGRRRVARSSPPPTRGWAAGCLQPHQGQHHPGAAPPTGTRITQHRASRERACSVHRYYVPTAERRTGTRAPYRSHVQTAERDSPNRDVEVTPFSARFGLIWQVEVTPFSARLGLIWQVKVTPFSARSRNCLSRPNMAAARL